MANAQGLKLKLLYLTQIFQEQSDEEHPLTINDLIMALGHYGLSAERKSLYTDIECLQHFGLDIICVKERANYYYLGQRDFELAELKLLVDAVQASRFITHKKSRALIKKIEKLTSTYGAKSLHRQVIVNDRVKTMNESIYYNVDAIHQAIQGNHMVEFKYQDYTVDKNLKLRRNGEVYCVSPYALTWADEYYYLMAYHERYQGVTQFRVDRMTGIEIADQEIPIEHRLKDFNVVEHSKNVFKMFGGKTQRVQLEFNNSLINVVIDQFGKDVLIHSKTEATFRITQAVATTHTFFGWLLMFGTEVRIIEPVSLKIQMQDYLKSVLQVYEQDNP